MARGFGTSKDRAAGEFGLQFIGFVGLIGFVGFIGLIGFRV